MTVATLADFLLARIAEDEAVAIAVRDSHDPLDWSAPPPWLMSGGAWGLDGPVDGPSGYSSIVIDPARVLAECAAKRDMIRDEPGDGEGDYYSGRDYQYDLTLRRLASVYADHSDYREDWKP